MNNLKLSIILSLQMKSHHSIVRIKNWKFDKWCKINVDENINTIIFFNVNIFYFFIYLFFYISRMNYLLFFFSVNFLNSYVVRVAYCLLEYLNRCTLREMWILRSCGLPMLNHINYCLTRTCNGRTVNSWKSIGSNLRFSSVYNKHVCTQCMYVFVYMYSLV